MWDVIVRRQPSVLWIASQSARRSVDLFTLGNVCGWNHALVVQHRCGKTGRNNTPRRALLGIVAGVNLPPAQSARVMLHLETGNQWSPQSVLQVRFVWFTPALPHSDGSNKLGSRAKCGSWLAMGGIQTCNLQVQMPRSHPLDYAR